MSVKRSVVMLYEPVEWNAEFIQQMSNRMSVGFHRYGSIYGEEHVGRDMIAAIRSRLEFYELTGNTEVLRDVANFAMIEATVPHHPNAHYTPLEHEATPPVLKDGKPWSKEQGR